MKNWCCQTGLNCRPLHYQWSALPLSYGSVPWTTRIGQKGFIGGPILATRHPRAQARGGRRVIKKWPELAGYAVGRRHLGELRPIPDLLIGC